MPYQFVGNAVGVHDVYNIIAYKLFVLWWDADVDKHGAEAMKPSAEAIVASKSDDRSSRHVVCSLSAFE